MSDRIRPEDITIRTELRPGDLGYITYLANRSIPVPPLWVPISGRKGILGIWENVKRAEI